jgi:hypothetical protein
VDGFTDPFVGQISVDVSYTFTVTIEENTVCPSKVGPYSISDINGVVDH